MECVRSSTTRLPTGVAGGLVRGAGSSAWVLTARPRSAGDQRHDTSLGATADRTNAIAMERGANGMRVASEEMLPQAVGGWTAGVQTPA